MATLTITEFALRLGVGMACGAALGIERQWRSRLPSLRTNALVATGATLFVLYSVAVGDATSPTRVASYVVSGVGFLGAGVIIKDGAGIRGINTAATIWCSAAVGCLAAAGELAFAITGTAAIVLVHLLLRPIGHAVERLPRTPTPPEEATPPRQTCNPRRTRVP